MSLCRQRLSKLRFSMCASSETNDAEAHSGALSATSAAAGCWRPERGKEEGSFLEIDAKGPHLFTGVVTQGCW